MNEGHRSQSFVADRQRSGQSTQASGFKTESGNTWGETRETQVDEELDRRSSSAPQDKSQLELRAAHTISSMASFLHARDQDFASDLVVHVQQG